MRIAVITGGPIPDDASVIVSCCDKVICADSGVDFCLKHGIVPDTVYGDLDSISEEGIDFVEKRSIPLEKHPSHKDETDTDIALSACPYDSEVVLVCSLTGRLDHVITNMGLLIKYKESGMDITATDGVTDVIPLVGEDRIAVEGISGNQTAVSLIPFATDHVTGLTTENLIYPLKDATVEAASSLYVSNEPSEGSRGFAVSMKTGRLLIVISPSL